MERIGTAHRLMGGPVPDTWHQECPCSHSLAPSASSRGGPTPPVWHRVSDEREPPVDFESRSREPGTEFVEGGVDGGWWGNRSTCGATHSVQCLGMKSIAILGASKDSTKFGNKAVRGFVQKGWTVFPINPNASTIEGLPAFRSISELPHRPNLVSVYLPPAILLEVLPEIAQVGCDELWLNPGADSPEVIERAESLGLNVIQACSLVGHGLSPYDIDR